MSGHSKWAQIKRQKGVTDIKRGQVFTKLATAITLAVKQGGGIADPNQNFRLRLIIERARAVNMPKENVARAIERGKGKTANGQELSEVVYEGFGPGGTLFIIEAVTDNKLRTTSEVKNVLEKNGARLGTPGAASYQFQKLGLVTVKKNAMPAGGQGVSTDEIFLTAADAGALDIEEAGEEVFIYTSSEDLAKVRDILSKTYEIFDAELIWKPILVVSINEKVTAAKVHSLSEKLEELSDVQKVFANFEIPT